MCLDTPMRCSSSPFQRSLQPATVPNNQHRHQVHDSQPVDLQSVITNREPINIYILVLLSLAPLSPAPSGDQSQRCKRPQRLFLDGDRQKPSFHFSPSSSSTSPQSPQPPHGALCWESPKLKAHHSYMNPTASSMAKSSRSSSVGEATQTPPRSPCFHRSRRSFGEAEAEGPESASSPLSPAPSLSSSPQPASSHSPVPSCLAAAVPPARPVQNVQPSRIPLPKQPLSPRRSLCLEVAPSCRVSTPPAGPVGDAMPAPGKQGWRRTEDK